MTFNDYIAILFITLGIIVAWIVVWMGIGAIRDAYFDRKKMKETNDALNTVSHIVPRTPYTPGFIPEEHGRSLPVERVSVEGDEQVRIPE